MKQSRSWQSAALLLTVMAFVSFACKKTPAPPPPPPTSTGTGITPAAPVLPAPTVTLRADTATITRGGMLTLTWESRNAATVDIQPGIGSVTPIAGGSRQVSPASSVTYRDNGNRAWRESSEIHCELPSTILLRPPWLPREVGKLWLLRQPLI